MFNLLSFADRSWQIALSFIAIIDVFITSKISARSPPGRSFTFD